MNGGVGLKVGDGGGVPFLDLLPRFDGRSGLVNCVLDSVLAIFCVGSMSVGDSFLDPIDCLLKRVWVVDGRFNVDMSECRAKVALACGKCRFAFGTPENRYQVCFLAIVAK